MPTLATGIYKRMWVDSRYNSSKGFSLLELMIVLVILGGLFSYAVVSYKQGDTRGRVIEEVKRIRAYLEAAQEEAVLKHKELALLFEHDRYRFLHLSEGKWQNIEDDHVFREYILPKGLSFHVAVQDGSIPLTSDKQTAEAMVLILSSGEVSPFELQVEATDGNAYALRSNFMGISEIYDPDGDRQ